MGNQRGLKRTLPNEKKAYEREMNTERIKA